MNFMPKIRYTLMIEGEIEVDNSVYMLNYEGQLGLIVNDVNFYKENINMHDIDNVEFVIVDDDFI